MKTQSRLFGLLLLLPLATAAAVDPAQLQAELVKMEHDFCTETLTPSVGPRSSVVAWLAVAAVYDRRSPRTAVTDRRYSF
jgi:hypothetical protein